MLGTSNENMRMSWTCLSCFELGDVGCAFQGVEAISDPTSPNEQQAPYLWCNLALLLCASAAQFKHFWKHIMKIRAMQAARCVWASIALSIAMHSRRSRQVCRLPHLRVNDVGRDVKCQVNTTEHVVEYYCSR
jgi:hypothetical protein